MVLGFETGPVPARVLARGWVTGWVPGQATDWARRSEPVSPLEQASASFLTSPVR